MTDAFDAAKTVLANTGHNCDNERKYSAFNRELLALFLATRHFRFLVEGRRFTAFVGHKPLTFAMAKSSEPWSVREQRQLSAIFEYTTDIQHVGGKDNFIADCLSRVVTGSVHLGLDHTAMAEDQAADSEVQVYRTAPRALLMVEVVFGTANTKLLCDVSTGQPCPMVPAGWRRKVFDTIHSLSQPGVKASAKLVGAKFVWPGLRKDVRAWAAVCVACQRAKVTRHTKAPLAPFKVPERRFDHLNVDLIGPLSPSFHLPPHHGGQEHQVARSGSPDLHHVS
jgi:cleavage and polyadenylation specificity factor subunit 1